MSEGALRDQPRGPRDYPPGGMWPAGGWNRPQSDVTVLGQPAGREAEDLLPVS